MNNNDTTSEWKLIYHNQCKIVCQPDKTQKQQQQQQQQLQLQLHTDRKFLMLIMMIPQM